MEQKFDISPILRSSASVKNVKSPQEVDRIVRSNGVLEVYDNPGKYGITDQEFKAFEEWDKRQTQKQLESNEELRKRNMKQDYKSRTGQYKY